MEPGPSWLVGDVRAMTMGLKIHRMMKDQRRDPEEIVAEAQQRREVSDSILDVIYHRLMDKHRRGDQRKKELEEEEL